MSYRDLSTEKMVQLSGPWVDPKRQRKAIESLPLAAALLPAIDEAHHGLLTIQSTQRAPRTSLAALQGEQTTRDKRHDRKMRGTINLLGALADLADDADASEQYLTLRDHLCPDGLKGITKSYDEEAGAAKLLPGRLDDADRKLLGKIAIPGGKLADAVDAWTTEAEALGVLEAQKVALLRQESEGEGVRKSDVQRARNQWIRSVRALEANLLLTPKGAEVAGDLLESLHEAEAQAGRKRGAGGKVANGDEGSPHAPPG
jgi:hypothetical protein